MRSVAFFFLILLGIGAFTGYQSAFIVEQTEQALVLEFQKPVKEIVNPGLYFKIPFIQTVEYFKKQILDIETNSQEVIASDQKRLKVDAFARYRITNPLLYRQRLKTQANARVQLINLVDSTIGQILARATFTDVVRDRRDGLLRDITAQVNGEAKGFGIEVVDVRLRRADLPEVNTQAVFRRMQTERQRESKEIRAKGEEIGLRIKADADRQVVVLVAEANRDAERMKGEGDAERNRIYAEAFSKDAEFFGFYRSMQAYEEALKSGSTRMVLSPSSEFFRYFNKPSASAPVPAPGKGERSGQ
jgi:modulator of FtsH protease HflC